MTLKFKEVEYQDFLWAKKSEKNGFFQWLPLKQHLIDVTNVIIQLWNHWLGEKQKNIVYEAIQTDNEEEALKMIAFLASVHDLAKATPSFQLKKGFNNSEDLDIILIQKLISYGFKDISSLHLINDNKSHHSVAGQVLLEKLGVPRSIASIVGAHHGSPPSDPSILRKQLRAYPENYYQIEDTDSKSNQLWHQIQEEIFDWALGYSGYSSVDEIPEIQMDGQVILSGLLIMADWIGSNEQYFPLQDLDVERVSLDKERAIRAWDKWHQTESWDPEWLFDIDAAFKTRFQFRPNDVQRNFLELAQSVDVPGLFILEAPMGSGKTEASLLVAEQLAAATGVNGVFFGLPTQATSNGIFKRLKMWVSKISEEADEKQSIQLVHGKAYLNEEYQEIKHNGYVGESHDETVIVNEWFSGRKTAIMDDFVIGTVDQFLMMSLKARHLMLRHLGFSKKVVIIDEVHAYDAYMNEFLKRSLMWLGSYNVPVIILSATLPGNTRKELIEAYMLGTGQKRIAIKQPNDLETTDAYPLITYSNNNEIQQFYDFNPFVDKEVVIEQLEETNVINLIEEKTIDGGVVGIIVNTVKKSQELAQKLASYFGEDMIELLHSSFIATERSEKENNLLNTIGKKGDRPYKKIIIGTQVIEQSLDIDFDLLITELAPMDLIIQRMGRLHRHQRDNRPVLLQIPKVYIMGINESYDFDKGSEAVYGAYLLIRTQVLLSNTIKLPSDISGLVQETYANQEVNIPLALLNRYDEAKKKHENLLAKKKSKAMTYLLNKPTKSKNKNLIGWLETSQRNQSEEKAVATVRDTSDSIEVILLKRFEDGYSLIGEFKNIKNIISDSAVQIEIAKNTIRLPNVLCQFYRIDQTIDELESFRVKYLNEWRMSSWLKGSLGIILDEENEFVLNGYRLKYDQKLGLEYGGIE